MLDYSDLVSHSGNCTLKYLLMMFVFGITSCLLESPVLTWFTFGMTALNGFAACHFYRAYLHALKLQKLTLHQLFSDPWRPHEEETES